MNLAERPLFDGWRTSWQWLSLRFEWNCVAENLSPLPLQAYIGTRE